MRYDRLRHAQDGQTSPRSDMRVFRFGLIIISFCSVNTANAQTQIYKCTDADGGVAYSQLPCPPQESVEPGKTEPDSKADSATAVSANQEQSITEAPQKEPELTTSRSACKKQYRDAIDAIDAEIGREYAADEAEQYKQRLLLLTRKLRQC